MPDGRFRFVASGFEVDGYQHATRQLFDDRFFEGLGVPVSLCQGQGVREFQVELDVRFARDKVDIEVVDSQTESVRHSADAGCAGFVGCCRRFDMHDCFGVPSSALISFSTISLSWWADSNEVPRRVPSFTSTKGRFPTNLVRTTTVPWTTPSTDSTRSRSRSVSPIGTSSMSARTAWEPSDQTDRNAITPTNSAAHASARKTNQSGK